VLSRIQKIPGFFVTGVLVPVTMGSEDNGGLSDEFFGGEYVPDVFWNKVDGEVVDLLGGVRVLMGGDETARIGGAGPAVGTLDLHALEAAILFDGDVVAGGISPRFGDAESAFRGASHEEQFNPFAALLIGFEVLRASAGRFIQPFSQGSTSQGTAEFACRARRTKEKARPVGRAFKIFLNSLLYNFIISCRKGVTRHICRIYFSFVCQQLTGFCHFLPIDKIFENRGFRPFPALSS
jgi:hypothetical protein